MREEITITIASVSPLAYTEEVSAHRGLALHQVIPMPTGGSVVGGPARFARADVETEPLVRRTGLTPRDVTVLRFLAVGWTTSDIAHELAYAESTIKKEVHIIVQRLGARNRTHAVAMAIRGEVI
ncbi:MAG: hypothetical protein QOJ52_2816 [Acidimicrobiaceae bacterium]|nr:hypothetical protein [Acidimicrobiaceae bacterium]MDQ1420854.1 hypothetical protein [Acidimicrobiaceae bacterium]MDQ1440160.1 hypothetical protein [Acidimicrobiaceae bacterium]